MSTEVLFDYDTHSYSFCISKNQIEYVYEKGNQAPCLVIHTRSNIGVDIEAGNNIYHLPCFQENSNCLLHAIRFHFRDKTVLIRTF